MSLPVAECGRLDVQVGNRRYDLVRLNDGWHAVDFPVLDSDGPEGALRYVTVCGEPYLMELANFPIVIAGPPAQLEPCCVEAIHRMQLADGILARGQS